MTFFPFQVLKSSPKDYDRLVFNYSLKNQLRFKGNLGWFQNPFLPKRARYHKCFVQ